MVSCEFIREIDFFGKIPELYLQGKSKQVTHVGRAFTAIYIIIYIIIFCYKLYRMLKRIDITFYDSYSNTNEIPQIHIDDENFTLAFGIFDEYNYPFIDETIYYPEAYFRGQGVEEVKIERCDLSKMNPEFKNNFDESDISNLYCLTNINYTLRPFSNSLKIELYPCQSNDEEGDYCEPKEFIDEYLNDKVFKIFFIDIMLTPADYETPVKEKLKISNTQIYKTIRQYLFTQMQLVKIETSTNIIGFDFLTEPKVQDFLKFDSESMLPYPGNDPDDIYIYYPYSIFELQLNDKILLEKRQYIQLIDVLGEIGGLMEIIFSFLNLISILIVDSLYEKNMTNNLFSFNVNKKFISIKKENNSTFIINKEIKEEQNLYNKNLSIYPFIKRKKKKKVKVKVVNLQTWNKEINSKISGNIAVNSLGNKIKIHNFENKSIKNSDKYPIKNREESDYNIVKNLNASQVNENDWIITNISLKDLFISRFHCGKKKKRNVYNLLLNESMEVMMEKLDIFNIFRNICSIEYANKNLEIIKMSKECSKDLTEIIK